MGEVNFASPRVRLAVHPLILISTLWLNDVQEYFWLTIQLIRSYDVLHRSKDLEPVLQWKGGLLFDHFIKRVSHDGNEHVQESKLRNQYCQDEESIAKEWIGMPNEALNVVLSNHEFELTQSWVKHEVLEDGLHDDIFFAADYIKLQHVHRIANVDQQDHHDQREVSNVAECLYYERHEEWCFVKQPKPVNDGFDSLKDKHTHAQDSFISHTHTSVLGQIGNHNPDCS